MLFFNAHLVDLRHSGSDIDSADSHHSSEEIGEADSSVEAILQYGDKDRVEVDPVPAIQIYEILRLEIGTAYGKYSGAGYYI